MVHGVAAEPSEGAQHTARRCKTAGDGAQGTRGTAISEEKQRLANHLTYFRETMNEEGGQGKKLGFIAQEMGREINTTGSKSNNAEMQNIVVKMKDELEQIKEQVLNAL